MQFHYAIEWLLLCSENLIYLHRGDHGAEGKDGGTVFDGGLVVKGSLGVQQQDGHLEI